MIIHHDIGIKIRKGIGKDEARKGQGLIQALKTKNAEEKTRTSTGCPTCS
jgi:hypothetical protein